MARDATWTNSDGLVVGFGTHTEDNNVPAVTSDLGPERAIVVEYDLASLPDTFAAANRSPQEVIIPRGSVFTRGYIETLVAVTGTNATLELGTWGTGDATDDPNGLMTAAATQATMANVGDVQLMEGALIADAADSGLAVAGATSNSDVVLAPSYETAAFTAGRIKVVVYYIAPSGSTGGTLAV
jgi:hypothetical protein